MLADIPTDEESDCSIDDISLMSDCESVSSCDDNNSDGYAEFVAKLK